MRKNIIHMLLAAALSSTSFAALAAEPQAQAPTPAVTAVEHSGVNINTADVDTLARELNGIGTAKARAIVEYREAHGEFAHVDELLEVKGIGLAILEKNLSKLTVK